MTASQCSNYTTRLYPIRDVLWAWRETNEPHPSCARVYFPQDLDLQCRDVSTSIVEHFTSTEFLAKADASFALYCLPRSHLLAPCHSTTMSRWAIRQLLRDGPVYIKQSKPIRMHGIYRKARSRGSCRSNYDILLQILNRIIEAKVLKAYAFKKKDLNVSEHQSVSSHNKQDLSMFGKQKWWIKTFRTYLNLWACWDLGREAGRVH